MPMLFFSRFLITRQSRRAAGVHRIFSVGNPSPFGNPASASSLRAASMSNACSEVSPRVSSK